DCPQAVFRFPLLLIPCIFQYSPCISSPRSPLKRPAVYIAFPDEVGGTATGAGRGGQAAGELFQVGAKYLQQLLLSLRLPGLGTLHDLVKAVQDHRQAPHCAQLVRKPGGPGVGSITWSSFL